MLEHAIRFLPGATAVGGDEYASKVSFGDFGVTNIAIE
jgi:hypothetical protein